MLPSSIESAPRDDQVVINPNDNRIYIIGTALPAAFGLTGSGTSLYLCLFPDDENNLAIVPGFLLAILFGWFVQLLMRRVLQAKDPGRRAALLEKLQTVPIISISLALAGLAITLAVWRFTAHDLPETFRILSGLSVFVAAIGVLLTPFSFAARRISWLVDPR